MNCSAEKASRKWAYGAFGRTAAAMVTVAAGLLLLGLLSDLALAAKTSRQPAWQSPWGDLFGIHPPRQRGKVHRAAVPLPRPRPTDAPTAEPAKPTADESSKEAAKETAKETTKEGKPTEQAAPQPPPPSACRLALTEAIAIAPSIPDIRGAGGCGGEDLVRLEAIVLPDKRQVSVKPAAILRCAMASALVDWIRTDIAPLAGRLGSTISDLDNFDSFECRGRNRIVGARLSEHGRANALDVRALKLANGRSISLTDRNVPRELREAVLHSACARFSTVLGPGSDWYHEDHIHLDLMERRNNYRICQWNVWDPLPQRAPLMPAERPEEAPPREVAAKSDAAKSDAAKPAAGKSSAAPADEKSDAVEVEPKPKPATKKRRQNRRS
ncbi:MULTISPECIES: extensin family protein [unclassified Bradyrhizobium]|uniref:extensin family protein n=1 Tax=unclassified Bradyrhizobium TaxID=2631580 RepID=UPI001BAC082A|nr:extensin family protein [Bradyrhizobium sp. AUGA SZCCT0176]MBR1295639.1 extensin family protein [Bradyrhizobium sp. AUGA SZCCT0042]